MGKRCTTSDSWNDGGTIVEIGAVETVLWDIAGGTCHGLKASASNVIASRAV